MNEAYQVLSDPEKRARYDQFGTADFDGSGSGCGLVALISQIWVVLEIYLSTYLEADGSSKKKKWAKKRCRYRI